MNSLKKITISFFTVFIFSGLIKWLGIWPIDATVLFGVLTMSSLLILATLRTFKTKFVLTKVETHFLALFLLFSVWFYVSMLYSDSTSYISIKATNYVLIILSFLVPYFTIDSKKDIELYLYALGGVGTIVSLIIFYLYLIGGNDLYFTYFKLLEYGNESGVPDYLALGTPVGLTSIIFLFLKNKYLKIVSLFSILVLILLSGRGPLLAVFIAALLIFISHFKISKVKPLNLLLTLVITIYGINYTLQWEGYQRLGSRIDVIETGDNSLNARIEQLDASKEMFFDSPILGIGLGAFGIKAYGVDMRAYPHNLLIEILVEQGLIGIILFLMFFIPFSFLIVRKLLSSQEPIFPILSGLLIYEFINALKSSSIVEHRLLFAIMGICIASYKLFLREKTLKAS